MKFCRAEFRSVKFNGMEFKNTKFRGAGVLHDKILAEEAPAAAKTARKAKSKFDAKRCWLNLKTDADFCGANFKIDAKLHRPNLKAEMKFCKANEADPKIARARRAEPEPLKFPGVNFT